MSQFLHDDDAKAIAIPPFFSENSRDKNENRFSYMAFLCIPFLMHGSTSRKG